MTAPALMRPSERRLLSREEAAEYCRLGTTMFDERVDEGILPRPMPKALTGRLVSWDRWEIDRRLTDMQLNEEAAGAADEDDWTRAA